MQKLTSYIYIFFLLLFSEEIKAQQLRLKIISKDSLENSFLSTITYLKTHPNKKSVYTETNKITRQLKLFGYFTNNISSIDRIDSIYIAKYHLGVRVQKVSITIPKNLILKMKKYKIIDDKITLDIIELPPLLTSISNQFKKKGRLFSEVQLKNISIKNNTLFAKLTINVSKQRTIDKIIIKGYKNFPKKFLKHYLNIKVGSIFNPEKIKKTSLNIKYLNFVSEIKPPEILFSKDSTNVYLYLKKEKSNNFDGLLGFASKKNKKGSFLNGHINLQLTNLLNKGEYFYFFWNSITNQKQELQLTTLIPYLLNSKFSLKISFNIFKQDSTFINTTFNNKIDYSFNSKSNLSFIFTTKNSNNLSAIVSNSIDSFKNNFYGLQYSYNILTKDIFNNNLFYISINPSFGKRTTNYSTNHQYRIKFEFSFLWSINERNNFFIRNESGYLQSDTYLENELFRIGGATNFRGFDEQSIYTSKYSYFNLEYRYLVSKESYFYSITDIGSLKNKKTKKLLGIGFGYSFKKNNSKTTIGYVLGGELNNFNQTKNGKITLRLLSVF